VSPQKVLHPNLLATNDTWTSIVCGQNCLSYLPALQLYESMSPLVNPLGVEANCVSTVNKARASARRRADVVSRHGPNAPELGKRYPSTQPILSAIFRIVIYIDGEDAIDGGGFCYL
jgi:hypothetical protein